MISAISIQVRLPFINKPCGLLRVIDHHQSVKLSNIEADPMTFTATIFPIPKPVSEDHITQYTRIRLAALKTNPEAFGSTHAGESAFSRDQWRKRVDNPARTTLFAPTAPSAVAGASSLERDVGWIGTLSLLGSEMLRGAPFPPKIMEAKERGDVEIYMLTGMWVHPDFRKKGVGRQLVEHALQILRDFSVIDNDQEDQNGEWNKGRQNILLLEVHKSNVEAQRLYETLGFVEQPGSEEDRSWMALTIT